MSCPAKDYLVAHSFPGEDWYRKRGAASTWPGFAGPASEKCTQSADISSSLSQLRFTKTPPRDGSCIYDMHALTAFPKHVSYKLHAASPL